MTEAVITLQHRCGADFGVSLEVLEMKQGEIIRPGFDVKPVWPLWLEVQPRFNQQPVRRR